MSGRNMKTDNAPIKDEYSHEQSLNNQPLNSLSRPIAALTPGTLYLVATPIGNLGDLTFRALEVLRQADVVLAEDTRHSKKLLSHYGLRPPVLSALHDHNESERLSRCLDRLRAGETVALISDAGTPLISDPGFLLVKACIEARLPVCPIPGPCAFVTALSAAGLPTQDVRFLWFLPAKSSARCAKLTALRSVSSVLGFYEAPHRMLATVTDMVSIFGPDRRAVLAHDITKRFESFVRGTLIDCLAELQLSPPKGEWVIWVAGYETEDREDGAQEWPDGAQSLLLSLRPHLPPKKVAAIVAGHYNLKKNACYAWLLSQSEAE